MTWFDYRGSYKGSGTSRRPRSRLTLLAVLSLMFGLIVGTSPAYSTGPVNIQAALTSDWIASHGGGFGETVDITVDDGSGPPFKYEVYDWPTGDISGTPQGGFPDGGFFHETGVDLLPGDIITVTDPAHDVSLTLVDLTFDVFDFDNSIASGTAPFGASVHVAVRAAAGPFCGDIVADGATGDPGIGSWSVDFSGPPCPPEVDPLPEPGGGAGVDNAEGNTTFVDSPPPPEQEGINGAGVNVSNRVVGTETEGYAFEVFIGTFGDFGGTTADDVAVFVDETPLDLADGIEVNPTGGDGWDLAVGGEYSGTPNLGFYTVEVTDGGEVVWGFEIGKLEDIPKDAPHMVFPTHLELTTERMPTIGWEEFDSDYLGSPVPAFSYEVNLGTSPNDCECSFVFPIDPGTTSIAYDDPNWDGDPLPIDGLVPGVYNATVHSGHEVAPGFTFEHHRGFQFVVYDPDGGFVTGGGWIESPEGAYAADPSLTGRATFGFVSKYKKGASIPTGGTEFQFRLADLNFHFNSYEWLVVAGPTARFKGTGTINGSGNYGFILTACDVSVTGSCQGEDADTFRIMIWDRDGGGLAYDNKVGSPDHSDDGTVLGGGNIVVHKK